MIELAGQIERITYANEESGYTVARMSVEGEREPVTIVGTLVDAAPGLACTVRGEWTNHPRFGRQFKVESYTPRAPRTPEAIERYLASGAIKGIGSATAKRIIAHFGADALEIMEKQIGRLREIPGIGKKRLAEITSAWRSQAGAREAMIFLQGSGVGAALAARIVARYGERAGAIIKRNPYRLAWEMSGVGFLTADRIAEGLGFPRDSSERSEAGVLHVMESAVDEGHVFLPLAELLKRCGELLGGDEGALRAVVERLGAEGRLILEREGAGGKASPAEAAVYLPRLHAAETGIAAKLARLAAGAPRQNGPTPEAGSPAPGAKAGEARREVAPAGESPPQGASAGMQERPDAAGDLRARITSAAAALRLELAPLQLGAILAAARHPATVITGGPGTGKTTIIRLLVRLFELDSRTPLLAAPTGRAAKRMSEATGREARTIHRLLEVDPSTGRFRKNEAERLDCDCLIVDEISMVDTLLMDALLAALPSGCRLVLVGDSDQLPSVGPGNLLADIIRSGKLPVVRLTEVFRQAEGSSIVAGAHAIIQGEQPQFDGKEGGELYFIEQNDPERVAALIVTLCRERIPKGFGLDPLSEIQVLSPMNRGEVGTIALNALLQEALNPPPILEREPAGRAARLPSRGESGGMARASSHGEGGGASRATTVRGDGDAGGQTLVRGARRYRPGDKVMQMRNDYERDVYNGDIGRVLRVDGERGELDALFEGRRVHYSLPDLDDLSLAYAMSVHKSQGSEFPAVVLPLLTEHYLLLQRNLLYTAVTRGKRLVVIVGSRKALGLAIRNNRTQVRHTGLAQRLSAVQLTYI